FSVVTERKVSEWLGGISELFAGEAAGTNATFSTLRPRLLSTKSKFVLTFKLLPSRSTPKVLRRALQALLELDNRYREGRRRVLRQRGGGTIAEVLLRVEGGTAGKACEEAMARKRGGGGGVRSVNLSKCKCREATE
ncbi:hypothetical protein GOP47_0003538, partial [Adiantum capillus-veneris]